MSLFLEKFRRKVKVIFVIDSLLVGGAESQLVMLVKELRARDFQCEVFALRGEGPFAEILRNIGVRVWSGGFSAERNRWTFFVGVFKLWFKILTSRPTVVHTYLPLSNFIGSVAARLAGAGIVITSRRGLGKHQDMERRWKYFDRISNFLSTNITVNSSAIEMDMVRRDNVDRRKIVLIRNGLDLSRFEFAAPSRHAMRMTLGLPQDVFAWVKVANLVDYKGHKDLLAAFSSLSKNANVRLFLVGRDRGALAGLKAIAIDLGISDKVVFMGNRDDVPQILSAMDGYVMASHTEGLSNAILEALAAGLPIVATDVGGNVEVLQNGELGILVESKNSDLMCEAMMKIVSNRCLRAKLSLAAKSAVKENYSVNGMVDSYLRLYCNGVAR